MEIWIISPIILILLAMSLRIVQENVSIDIAAVAYYHIVDPKKSVIAIEDVYSAVNQISQTTA